MRVAQDHLATIRKAVGAVLRRHGFRTDSTRLWRRGDDVEGWVVVAWQGDKWNTKRGRVWRYRDNWSLPPAADG